MRFVILGATGQTGTCLMQMALDAGHEVTAVARNPDRLTIKHDKLKAVPGNIFSAESLAPIFTGHDAVLSCLGFPRTKPVTGYVESVKSVTEAMKRENVKRLVVISSQFTDLDSGYNKGFVYKYALIPFLKNLLIGMRQMEVYLEENCSDINYLIVRPKGLNSKPDSGKEFTVGENQFVLEGDRGMTMPRADVARFMLQEVGRDKFSNVAVAISTK